MYYLESRNLKKEHSENHIYIYIYVNLYINKLQMRNEKIKINITNNLALKHKGTLKIIYNIESHTNIEREGKKTPKYMYEKQKRMSNT